MMLEGWHNRELKEPDTPAIFFADTQLIWSCILKKDIWNCRQIFLESHICMLLYIDSQVHSYSCVRIYLLRSDRLQPQFCVLVQSKV